MSGEQGLDQAARITLSQVHTTLTELKSVVETSLVEQRAQITTLTERQTATEGRVNQHDDRIRLVELSQASAGAVQGLTVAADQARTNRTPAWVSIVIAASSLLLAATLGVATLWKG